MPHRRLRHHPDLRLRCACARTSGAAAKPAAQIYRHALDRLGVAAQAALFVDDNPTSCAGAAALGLPVAQMDRGGVDDFLAGATVVRSLPEVEEMLREPGRR